jgi:hypothetical protein
VITTQKRGTLSGLIESSLLLSIRPAEVDKNRYFTWIKKRATLQISLRALSFHSEVMLEELDRRYCFGGRAPWSGSGRAPGTGNGAGPASRSRYVALLGVPATWWRSGCEGTWNCQTSVVVQAVRARVNTILPGRSVRKMNN